MPYDPVTASAPAVLRREISVEHFETGGRGRFKLSPAPFPLHQLARDAGVPGIARCRGVFFVWRFLTACFVDQGLSPVASAHAERESKGQCGAE